MAILPFPAQRPFFVLVVLQFTEISFRSSTFFSLYFLPHNLILFLERGCLKKKRKKKRKYHESSWKTADCPEPRACESNQTWKSDGEADAGGLLLSVIQWGTKGMEFFWLTVRRHRPYRGGDLLIHFESVSVLTLRNKYIYYIQITSVRLSFPLKKRK